MPEITKPFIQIDPNDVTALAYIHSNKFITTKLFHKKFHSNQSYKTAYLRLRSL